MSKKVSKLVLVIMSLTLLFFILCIIIDKKPTFADSGFDASYDGGGGGVDSYDSGSSYSSSGGISFWPYDFLIAILILGIHFAWYSKKDKREKQQLTKENEKENETSLIIESQLKQIIPDFDREHFLYDGFKMYCDIQMAWMNFNLESVRNLLTDEMYNMYSSQLETLKVKGEQNIMGQFIPHDGKLINYIIQNDTITITTRYIIELYDFIINQNTGLPLRGSPIDKLKIKYEMKFRKTLNPAKKITKCPNCGASIDMNTSGICDYCHTKIVTENINWVLTDKKALGQSYNLKDLIP